jgi:isopenicillin-N N-acyltransferase-like protein
MFQYTSNLAWKDVREVAKELQPALENLTPQLFTEMSAIAAGAELDVLDIIALNCRSEIALGKFSDGCTSLSWKKNDGARLLSQNWDWTETVRKNLAMVSIEQAGKPTIYMVTEVSAMCPYLDASTVLSASRQGLWARLGSTPMALGPVLMQSEPNR